MMVELFIYKHYPLSAEKLKDADNLNLLKIGYWKCISRRLISNEQLNKRRFEEEVLPAIAEDLDEHEWEGTFDVREQKGNKGFKSLMGGNYLVL